MLDIDIRIHEYQLEDIVNNIASDASIKPVSPEMSQFWEPDTRLLVLSYLTSMLP